MTALLAVGAVDAPDAPDMEREGSSSAAWAALAVLVAATIVGAVDRQLLVLMAEPLKLALHLSDTQLGLLQGAGVTLFAGLAAFPIGWLADRYDRRLILAACVLLWSASTAACGLAQDFTGLMLAATGLGLGEAGLVPIVYGLIPDLFGRRRRPAANAVYGIAAVFGAGIGIALSAQLLGAAAALRGMLPALAVLEDWRVAFLAAAATGPLVAAAIGLLRIQRRTGAASTGEADPFLPFLRRHGRTLAAVFAGVGTGSLGMTALGTWLPVVAAREHGATVGQVGTAMGIAFALGTVVGGALSAGQARLLRRHGIAGLVRALWLCIGTAGLATAAMPLAAQDLTLLFTLFGGAVAALFVGVTVYASLIQQISPAPLRSRTLAINATVTALLSAASPVLVGLLSDRLGDGGHGLLKAVVIVSAGAMLAGAALLRRCEAGVVRSALEVDR